MSLDGKKFVKKTAAVVATNYVADCNMRVAPFPDLGATGPATPAIAANTG
jgi:hypothetical protein